MRQLPAEPQPVTGRNQDALSSPPKLRPQLVHVDNQRLTAGPGCWVTLAKGSLHYFKNIGQSRGKMLILATPAGLDQFFLEAGRVATDTSPESGAATSEDIERLLAIAPKYGIEIKLPQA